jgi:hypothetical protein
VIAPFKFNLGDPVRVKKPGPGEGRRGIVFDRKEGKMHTTNGIEHTTNGIEHMYNFYDPTTDTYHEGGWFEWALEFDRDEI